jgi:hypothetical protein
MFKKKEKRMVLNFRSTCFVFMYAFDTSLSFMCVCVFFFSAKGVAGFNPFRYLPHRTWPTQSGQSARRRKIPSGRLPEGQGKL